MACWWHNSSLVTNLALSHFLDFLQIVSNFFFSHCRILPRFEHNQAFNIENVGEILFQKWEKVPCYEDNIEKSFEIHSILYVRGIIQR